MKPGTINRVRVFEDRVSIRRINVSEPDGRRALFGPLPDNLDPDSIRAHIVGDAEGVRIQGVTVTPCDRPKDPAYEKLLAAHKATELEILALDDEEETERKAAEHLERYAGLAADKLSEDWLGKEPDFERWSQVFDEFRQTQYDLSVRTAGRIERRRQLTLRGADLLEELQRMDGEEEPGHQVEVAISGAEEPVSVEISYLTHAGRWRASYEAYLDDDTVRLVALADVEQSTGEDWVDVELIASTARPSKSEPPPSMRKIEIQSRADKGNREVVSTHEREDELEGGPSGPGGPEAAGPSTVEHKAPGVVNVPSTGRPTRVELFRCELSARRHLEVCPLVKSIVVEIAKVSNDSQFVLLPGRMKIHRGEKYSGTTRIKQVAAGESFSVPVGSEGSLRVKRRVHTAATERGIAGGRTMNHEVDIEVHNVSSEPRALIVRDRVPVSRTQDSRVAIKSLDRAIEVDGVTGLTTASIEVGPYERRNLRVSFSLTVPRGVKVRPPGGI